MCHCMIVRPLLMPHKRSGGPKKTNEKKAPADGDVESEDEAAASPQPPKRRGRAQSGNGLSEAGNIIANNLRATFKHAITLTSHVYMSPLICHNVYVTQ